MVTLVQCMLKMPSLNKTLQEAQQTQFIDSITLVIYSCPNLVVAKMAHFGGAYFSAVCGSNLVPVSATEGHGHRVCYRLLGFFSRVHFFCFPKFAVLKAGQLAGSFFANMVGKMTNTCEHQRVRRLR